MENRRDFLKKATLLTSGAALINSLPPVIQRALAINPEEGSTFYDAEHIVFLMQENRSFDHVFGRLQGVRGFNDPRAIQLPNQNSVWLQTDKENRTYAPFHLNVANTKVAWMGALPHNWADQVDARNGGKYDKWLHVKAPYNKNYKDMPLTMGYCDRSDFPFYYSLADAFTVCDQNFCSGITCTHPNRLYWMTGTIRESENPSIKAQVTNVQDYEKPTLNWKTYPERLEEECVSWKVYQNETTMGYGLKGEESAWLSNFGTNVLEYFQQYNIRLNPSAIANLQVKKEKILKDIANLENMVASEERTKKKDELNEMLKKVEQDQERYTLAEYDKLSPTQKELNKKAFSNNSEDPDYHNLMPMSYDDNGTIRELNVPKGDVLHQFRKDVENQELPTVSWLMPPANFSDHPGVPWFGPWYVSEVMEILTKNPEVWKKTIFILTYDENDGYFDHVPPYVVPNPYKEGTGKVSSGIDAKLDYATKEQHTNPSGKEENYRESSLGLGYRVPMIVASPWSRGGFVNSQVFDHTSSLQFLEDFLEKKTLKPILAKNISKWRRTICGDITSCFRPYNGEKLMKPTFLEKNAFMEGIHQAQFKNSPNNFKALSENEIKEINNDRMQSDHFIKQERGIRDACALPYELYVNGAFNKVSSEYEISFSAANQVFGKRASGAPFQVYAINNFSGEVLRNWDYTVAAGDMLKDGWNINDFDGKDYHLRVYGPNGFFREFKGNQEHPLLQVKCGVQFSNASKGSLTNRLVLILQNNDSIARTLQVIDNSYKTGTRTIELAPQNTNTIILNLKDSYGWYDYSIKCDGFTSFEERFAGRIETGRISKTDPLMGQMV